MTAYMLQSRNVVLGGRVRPAAIAVEDGRIAAVLPHGKGRPCTVIDYGDAVILPGLVDTHVHINDPGRTDWEGFETATHAAAAGGISTLVDMPLNCIPVTTTRQALSEKLDTVKGQLWVDCGFWGGITPDNLDDLESLLQAGVLGCKSFLIHSGIDDFRQVTETELRQAMPLMAKYKLPYLVHAELECGGPGDDGIGRSYSRFLASRPKQWENEAIALMIRLQRELFDEGIVCPVHIVHLSSAEALPMIRAAKADGLPLSVETCPHYLTLEAEGIADGQTVYKCCPPIRERDNRELLWEGLKDGTIDCVVSDHSPCTPQLKHLDEGDLGAAWGGISALQFGLPLIWTEGQRHGMDFGDLARLLSSRPAELAGIGERKGRIAPGFDADFAIFDPTPETVISAEHIHHKHKISPYLGKRVLGKVLATYVRGHRVFNDDRFETGPIGEPLLQPKTPTGAPA